MKAIVTVIGKDQVGITAAVCSLLAQHSINILDISQTILSGLFNMVLIADISSANCDFSALSDALTAFGQERNLQVRVQRSEIFEAMHQI